VPPDQTKPVGSPEKKVEFKSVDAKTTQQATVLPEITKPNLSLFG